MKFIPRKITWELLNIGTLDSPFGVMPGAGMATVTGQLEFTFRLSQADDDAIMAIVEEAALREVRKAAAAQ